MSIVMSYVDCGDDGWVGGDDGWVGGQMTVRVDLFTMSGCIVC